MQETTEKMGGHQTATLTDIDLSMRVEVRDIGHSKNGRLPLDQPEPER